MSRSSFPANRAAPGVLPLPLERGGLWERVGQALRWRGLLQYLTISTLKAGQHNTLLGYLWWVLDPLLLMAVYVVLVDIIFDKGVANYPVFVLAAVLPWKWFANSLQDSMSSLVGKERLIKQVAFPKVVIPLSQVLANLVSFSFGLLVLIAFVLASRISITWAILTLPLVVGGQLLLTLGMALLISSVNVFFRDVQNMSRYGLRLWFYLSPSLYTIDLVPERFRDLYLLNPFAHIFTAYRDALMNGSVPAGDDLLWVYGWGALALALGLAVFSRLEPRLAKVL